MAIDDTARIVAIDDDPDILALIEVECSAAGHAVTTVQDARSGLATVRSVRPQILLLDLVMPHHSGEDLCREIRADASLRDIWIIILSAKNTEEDVVKSLDAGADDYLRKPFGFGELTARIRSTLRRASVDADEEVIRRSSLTINMTLHSAEISGEAIDLTPAQFRLLTHLVQHPGRVFSREALVNVIAGSLSQSSPRTIDAHIKSLRRKLGDLREQIETVRSVGYRWTNPVSGSQDG